MAEPGAGPTVDRATGTTSPLSSIVKVHLALACVWGPYAFGWLLPMASWTVQFITAEGSALDKSWSNHLLGLELTYWLGVALGVVATPIALPKVWPAAGRIQAFRRTCAGILGPAAPPAAGLVARRIGALASPESSLLVEPLVIALGTALGVSLLWPILLESE